MEIQTYLNPIDNNWWAYYELKPLVIGKGRTKEEAVENLIAATFSENTVNRISYVE